MRQAVIRKNVGGRLASGELEAMELKAELAKYLVVREERKADEAAKKEVGKVIGGSRGNAVLEWVSGAPNKPKIVEEEPGVFDYEELLKYGFGHLVRPVMDAGGRLECYRMMGMTPPPPPKRLQPKKARKLVIDRTGEGDPNRYRGLKMGQVLDDEEMGRVLREVQDKKRRGEPVKTYTEAPFEVPFADKRNTSPAWTPDWTPEKLDEQGRKRGQALSWARKAKQGQFLQDPFEIFAIEGHLRLYTVFASLLVAIAFGNSSPAFFSSIGFQHDALLDTFRYPAAAVVAAAFGSSVLAGIMAKHKGRNAFLWALKGFAAGPVAVYQIRSLGPLEKRPGTLDPTQFI